MAVSTNGSLGSDGSVGGGGGGSNKKRAMVEPDTEPVSDPMEGREERSLSKKWQRVRISNRMEDMLSAASGGVRIYGALGWRALNRRGYLRTHEFVSHRGFRYLRHGSQRKDHLQRDRRGTAFSLGGPHAQPAFAPHRRLVPANQLEHLRPLRSRAGYLYGLRARPLVGTARGR